MCDVQRFAFSDLADMGDEFTARLAANGVDESAYESFRSRLETDATLRQNVLAGYREYCDDIDSEEG